MEKENSQKPTSAKLDRDLLRRVKLTCAQLDVTQTIAMETGLEMWLASVAPGASHPLNPNPTSLAPDIAEIVKSLETLGPDARATVLVLTNALVRQAQPGDRRTKKTS